MAASKKSLFLFVWLSVNHLVNIILIMCSFRILVILTPQPYGLGVWSPHCVTFCFASASQTSSDATATIWCSKLIIIYFEFSFQGSFLELHSPICEWYQLSWEVREGMAPLCSLLEYIPFLLLNVDLICCYFLSLAFYLYHNGIPIWWSRSLARYASILHK